MLGEKIQDLQARITGVRVLPGEDKAAPKVEVSFQGNGKLLGHEITEMGTYCSAAQPDGAHYGECTGIVMTKKGETVSFTASGRGKPTGKGMGATWRGVLYFTSTATRFARLNGIPTVFEWDVDEEGNAKASVWEWK